MLPIHDVRDRILDVLRQGDRLVLTAPTGSGKTTQVPQMLYASGLIAGRILILQPRRLAARLVAVRVAAEMRVPLGQLVGYQTRHDSRVSDATQITFLTEGLFLRQLQSNPTLRGIGAVILDEFHERNLASDTALAVVARLQSRRPGLKLLVMSATLDVDKVTAYLGCPAVEAHGRLHPVEISYLPQRPASPPWEVAAEALADLARQGIEGDVLVFMPGSYEIRRTLDAARRSLPSSIQASFLPLHGEMPPEQQDLAVQPDDTPGRPPRIIVSTNVAQTSITIEGVRHVIDSGLARVSRFDPRRGINTLLLEPISQAAADQRAGRAGRVAPGTCLRLWSLAEQRGRPAHDTPEVRRLDLAEVVLQLLALGLARLEDFPWLETPDPLSLQRAIALLQSLGALDAGIAITPLGHAMARLPMHPRLSRMLAEAQRRRCLPRAALWAALVSERDILQRSAGQRFHDEALSRGGECDFLVLELAFDAARHARFDPVRCAALGVHGLACREIEHTWKLYLDAAGDRSARHDLRAPLGSPEGLDDLIKCLLLAYPDHVALRRSEANLNCALVDKTRRSVTLDPPSLVRSAGLLLAVEIREVGAGGAVKTVLSLASRVDPAWLEELHPAPRTRRETAVVWNPQRQAVDRVDRRVYDDLVFEEVVRGQPDPDQAAAILADRIAAGELKLEKWDDEVDQWIARARCVAQWFPERKLLTYEPDDLRVIFLEICSGAVRFNQVADRPCLAAVREALSWDDQQFVEQMAPARFPLPSGYKMKIEYQPGSPPRGRAKIQDFYDLKHSPVVAAGRERVLLDILGPNFRPLQTTDDLAGFWTNLYPTLRKELSRRYPRHEWR